MWKSALSPCQCWIGLFLQPLLELVGEKWHPEFNEFDDRFQRFQQWWENKTNQLVLQRGLKPSIWRSRHDELELFFSNPLNWEVKVVWDDWLICYSGGNFGSFYLQNFLICRTTKSRGENFLSIVQLKLKWKRVFWSFHFNLNHIQCWSLFFCLLGRDVEIN